MVALASDPVSYDKEHWQDTSVEPARYRGRLSNGDCRAFFLVVYLAPGAVGVLPVTPGISGSNAGCGVSEHVDRILTTSGSSKYEGAGDELPNASS
jgi:hypothetical protein